MKTAVTEIIEKLQKIGVYSKKVEKICTEGLSAEKDMLCNLVEQLKDYTHESQSILGHDEREPIEFVSIFLKSKECKCIRLVGATEWNTASCEIHGGK